MRIGIYGGSFNPVHAGHLRLARYAHAELNLSKVIFVPSYQQPLKTGQRALPAASRYRLLKKAVAKTPYFEVSDCELVRKGLSYTVETLEYFHARYGRHAVLYFLAGADTLKHIDRWKALPRILELARFVVMSRPGYPMDLGRKDFLWMPFDAVDISSTRLREKTQAA